MLNFLLTHFSPQFSWFFVVQQADRGISIWRMNVREWEDYFDLGYFTDNFLRTTFGIQKIPL